MNLLNLKCYQLNIILKVAYFEVEYFEPLHGDKDRSKGFHRKLPQKFKQEVMVAWIVRIVEEVSDNWTIDML